MTGSPKGKVLPASVRGRSSLILAFIALAAAIPRFLLGASQFVEYDGYWHIFIAQQDTWRRFWADFSGDAHPLLYMLLLRAVLHLGRSLLIYRGISLVTGVASVFLMGRIALKVTGSNIRAYQTALAYGLALPAIIISCEVRSYMLSVFFVLLSYSCLLDIPKTGSRTTSRFGFALGAILACLSDYVAFFFSGAAILLLFGRFILRGKWKSEVAAEAATSLPVLAGMGALYVFHARKFAHIQDHLLPYYYDPNGSETIAGFLTRNWRNFLNFFSPFEVSSAALALGILTVAVIVAAIVLWRQRETIAVTWTLLVTALMLAEFVVASLTGKYPFGGDMRQQFLHFPFLVLSGAVVVEQAARRFGNAIPAPGRLLLNVLAIAAIVWISLVQYQQYPKITQSVDADKMGVFDSLEPAPTAVYLDQFNLITFFTFHRDWSWSSISLSPPVPDIDAYRLRRGGQQMLVLRDKADWNVEPDDDSVYGRLAECLHEKDVPELSVFSARQSPPKEPFSNLKRVKRTVVTLASQSAVCVQRMAVNPVGWYVTFRRTNCAPQNIAPIQVAGVFDNVSEDIEYMGSWTHGLYAPAFGGTVSYSNAAGASVRLSFEGTELTYIYSKAFNRGIAQIRLDGVARPEIDLYSRKTEWQSRTVFRDLKPGKHTFEVLVSGRKNAAATNHYVDLDAVIVH